jgi:hypothetical protein
MPMPRNGARCAGGAQFARRSRAAAYTAPDAAAALSLKRCAGSASFAQRLREKEELTHAEREQAQPYHGFSTRA